MLVFTTFNTTHCIVLCFFVSPIQKKQRKGKSKEMDWTKWSQRHVALKFGYLGWDYAGLAAQAETENTIEVRNSQFLPLSHLLPSSIPFFLDICV